MVHVAVECSEYGTFMSHKVLALHLGFCEDEDFQVWVVFRKLDDCIDTLIFVLAQDNPVCDCLWDLGLFSAHQVKKDGVFETLNCYLLNIERHSC